MRLTKALVQHIQRHLIALLRPRDRDEPLVAIVLRLVDLDDATAELANLVDLRPALSNDRAHHIVGYEDLLGQGLTGQSSRRPTAHWLLGVCRIARLRAGRLPVRLSSGHGRAAVGVAWRLGRPVCHWRMVLRRQDLSGLCIGNAIGIRRLAPGLLRRVLAITVQETPLAARGLRCVWDDLHATRDDSGRAATASRISRCSRSAEPLRQLFNKCATDVVGCNVNGVGNTKNHEGSLGAQRQARVRRIQSSARGLLDLPDSNALLANDGPDEDVRDEESERIGLGVDARGLFQRFLIQGANDQSKGLVSSVSIV